MLCGSVNRWNSLYHGCQLTSSTQIGLENFLWWQLKYHKRTQNGHQTSNVTPVILTVNCLVLYLRMILLRKMCSLFQDQHGTGSCWACSVIHSLQLIGGLKFEPPKYHFLWKNHGGKNDLFLLENLSLGWYAIINNRNQSTRCYSFSLGHFGNSMSGTHFSPSRWYLRFLAVLTFSLLYHLALFDYFWNIKVLWLCWIYNLPKIIYNF